MGIGYIFSRVLRKSRGIALRRTRIDRTAKIESGSTVIDTVVARHSFCGYDCTIVNCEIGSFCSIASRVSVGGARHPMEYVSTSPVFLSHRDSVKKKYSRHIYRVLPRTVIGSDVWIGEGAFIKSGVRVGHGAVIGMGSVVTKDVPNYGVVAGNPAKLIRMRFDDKIVRGLLGLRWWEMEDERLEKLASLFNDPLALLKQEGLL